MDDVTKQLIKTIDAIGCVDPNRLDTYKVAKSEALRLRDMTGKDHGDLRLVAIQTARAMDYYMQAVMTTDRRKMRRLMQKGSDKVSSALKAYDRIVTSYGV